MTPYTVRNMDDKSLLHDDDIVREDDGLVFNPYNPPITEVEKTWATKSAGIAAIPK